MKNIDCYHICNGRVRIMFSLLFLMFVLGLLTSCMLREGSSMSISEKYPNGISINEALGKMSKPYPVKAAARRSTGLSQRELRSTVFYSIVVLDEMLVLHFNWDKKLIEKQSMATPH